MFKSPKIPEAPKMPKAPAPIESIKDATADAAAGRDKALRRMAQRASISATNKTADGLGAVATTNKTLLGA
jgi:hypothetical protein